MDHRGDRMVLVQFPPNTIRLGIVVGNESDWNQNINGANNIPLNEWTTVSINVADTKFTVRISDGFYKQLTIGNRETGFANIYVSDNFHYSASAQIKNLKITNLSGKSI